GATLASSCVQLETTRRGHEIGSIVSWCNDVIVYILWKFQLLIGFHRLPLNNKGFIFDSDLKTVLRHGPPYLRQFIQRRGLFQKCLYRMTNILLKKGRHRGPCGILKMLPCVITYIIIPVGAQKRLLQFLKFGIGSRVKYNQYGFITTGAAIIRKLQLFTPAPLT